MFTLQKAKRRKWRIFTWNNNILISKEKSYHLNLTFKFPPSGWMNYRNSGTWIVKGWIGLLCNLEVLLFARATFSDCCKRELTSVLIMTRITLKELNETMEGLRAKSVLAVNVFDIYNAELHALFWKTRQVTQTKL